VLLPCYRASWERPEFTVFGVWLFPATLAHARTLWLAESPVVVHDAGEITMADLLLAVGILSVQSPPVTSEEIAAVGRRVAGKVVAGNDRENMDAFKRYWNAYVSPVPRFHPADAAPRIPWPWYHCAMLMRYYGMAQGDAWQTLCADAFWLSASASVMNGETSVMTLEQQRIRSMIKEGE